MSEQDIDQEVLKLFQKYGKEGILKRLRYSTKANLIICHMKSEGYPAEAIANRLVLPTSTIKKRCSACYKLKSKRLPNYHNNKQPINRIKIVLLEKDLKKGYLANALEVAERTVGRWLSNNTQPKLEQLLVIARALGVSPADLLVDADKVN